MLCQRVNQRTGLILRTVALSPMAAVWGRGSSDMKGSCAAAMVSARILNEMDSIPNTVEYWFTCDEEIGGGAGARWLAEYW